MKSRPRSPQVSNLSQRIIECIECEKYTQTLHAFERQTERNIQLMDALQVLRTGYHEKRKTSWDEAHHSWKYAIRGKTADGLDVRVIVAFDDDGMLIITVMQVI